MSRASVNRVLPAIYYQEPQNAELQQIEPETFVAKRAMDWSAGTHIFYFPSIEKYFSTDAATSSLPQYFINIRDHVTKEFSVPTWFWERRGWDGNGFFGNVEDPVEGLEANARSQSTFSRFLTKELGAETAEGWEYHWRFLAFCTLWIRRPNEKKLTAIVLCFDLVETETKPGGSMHSIFHSQLQSIASREEAHKCPYAIYAPLVDVIASQYNRAVWSYRGPVKSMEEMNKNQTDNLRLPSRRGTTLSEMPLDDDEDDHERNKKAIQKDRDSKMDQYKRMHALARHIIHISETLEVAVRTIEDIIRDAKECSQPCCGASAAAGEKVGGRTVRSLRTHASGLQNLDARSEAFYKRIKNEITLAFHLGDADDTSYTREILEETKHDGRELTSVVSFLSILFLPPTFTAGFFGMNFPFNFGSLRPIWMWAVISVVLCIAAFGALHFSRQKRHNDLRGALKKKKKEKGKEKVKMSNASKV